MGSQKQIAELLLKSGAVKLRMDPLFTWISGIRSPVYCDNRILISHPDFRSSIVKAFAQKIKELQVAPEYIGGTATAAIPWAAFVAYELNLPMIYIRPEKKDHGAGRQVEGFLPSGKYVLIIEDLISTGGSSIKAARAVQEECKCVVTTVMAIVTYELDEAVKTFRESGLQLITLTNFSTIAAQALQRGDITELEWRMISEFRKNPRAWAAEMKL